MAYPWKNMNLIPMADLEAWHMYEPGVSGHNVIYDYSGHDRHLTCGAGNAPVLTADVLNGQPGWYFNGSRDPLAWTGSVTLKHVFLVISLTDATFSAHHGILSGLTAGDILTTSNTGTLFYDLSATSSRTRDILYASNAHVAPISENAAVVEVVFAAGVTMDGIQIGKQRDISGPARLHKGYFFDDVCYSAVKNDQERLRIYQYAAMRYHLWQRTAAGLDVYPFVTNKPRSSELDQERYVSEPYSGDPTVLVRGSAKRAFTLPFTARTQAEFEAAETFHGAHRQPTHFAYRDYRFYPARDSECTITSSLREQGSDVTNRFNFAFDIAETG